MPPPDTYTSHGSSASSALSAAQRTWDDCHAAAVKVRAEVNTAAQQAWQDCHTAAVKVRADVNTAADTCHDTIADAAGMRFHKNPSGWAS